MKSLGVLVRKLAWDIRWGLLLTSLLLASFQMLWVKATQRVTTQVAPMFQIVARAQNKKMEEVERQLFRGPGRVMQTVIGGDQLRFERAQDVLSIGYVHPLMQVVLSLWAIGRAAGALAGEIDRGTMELLLAQPIRRSFLVLAHLIVDLVAIPCLCISLWAGLYLGTIFVGPLQPDVDMYKDFPVVLQEIDPAVLEMDVRSFGWPLVNVGALMFALSGLTMALSSLERSRWRVIGGASAVLVLLFVFNIIGQIWESAAILRPLSLFYYYQPQNIALRGVWTVSLEPWGLDAEVLAVGVLFALGVIGYVIALRVFMNRDIPAPL